MSFIQEKAADRIFRSRSDCKQGSGPVPSRRVVAIRNGVEVYEEVRTNAVPTLASPRTAISTGRVARHASPKVIAPQVIEAPKAAVIEAAPAYIVPRAQRPGPADRAALKAPKVLECRLQASAPPKPQAPARAKPATRGADTLAHLRTLAGKPIVPANKPLSRKELALAYFILNGGTMPGQAVAQPRTPSVIKTELTADQKKVEEQRALILARIEQLDPIVIARLHRDTPGKQTPWPTKEHLHRTLSGGGLDGTLEVFITRCEAAMKRRGKRK